MSLSRYAHLIGWALSTPWAVDPEMLAFIAGILAGRLDGHASDPAAIEAALVARKDDAPLRRGRGAIIPIYGVLAPRANLLTQASGGASFEALGHDLSAALADPAVDWILFDVDSPGGSVAGAREFAAQIRAGRAVKPIIAHANHQMNSAAYWIASNATKVYASPSATVGSIGVFSMHDDLTDALAKVGIKREYIAAGKYKLDGNVPGPLSDDARAYVQAMVATTYGHFVDDVAKGRNVKRVDVTRGFGEGRSMLAEAALDAGMVDAIQTIDDTIARLLPSGGAAALTRADTSQEPLQATDQDRRRDSDWQACIERDLLALTLP